MLVMASLRRLSVFKAVVEHAGVNAAAIELGISKPSVTAHIKALERELGVSLFVRRRGRKLQPTQAGESLYAYACELVIKDRTFRSQRKDYDLQDTQGFRLAAQRTLASTMVAGRLAGFLKQFSGARISAHSETQEVVRDLVRTDKADIGVLFASPDEKSSASIIGNEKLVF